MPHLKYPIFNVDLVAGLYPDNRIVKDVKKEISEIRSLQETIVVAVHEDPECSKGEVVVEILHEKFTPINEWAHSPYVTSHTMEVPLVEVEQFFGKSIVDLYARRREGFKISAVLEFTYN